MNNLLIQEFSNKLRPSLEVLQLEINKHPLDTKECIKKIREIKINITHLNNLMKIEEVLNEKKLLKRTKNMTFLK